MITRLLAFHLNYTYLRFEKASFFVHFNGSAVRPTRLLNNNVYNKNRSQRDTKRHEKI